MNILNLNNEEVSENSLTSLSELNLRPVSTSRRTLTNTRSENGFICVFIYVQKYTQSHTRINNGTKRSATMIDF